jgi:hypothetical protein
MIIFYSLGSVSSLFSEKKIFESVRRLLSVVCKLFTFQASSPKPLGQLEPNLAGMFLGWSSTKYLVKDIPMIIFYSLGSVSSLFSEKKIFEISANQSILLALAAILNIRLERKTVTL